MGADTTPDLTTAEEIVASDYAHDEASPELPWAANRVLGELGRVRLELTEYGDKYVTAQRELDAARARITVLEAGEQWTPIAYEEARTEWGVARDGAEADDYGTDVERAVVEARRLGRPLVARQVRSAYTQWTPVDDEEIRDA